MKLVIATLAAVAAAAAACTPAGERAVGETGFPAVEYLGCCDGAEPVAVDGTWGLICPGGEVTADSAVYKAGERCLGEAGFPSVAFRPCERGTTCTGRRADTWGRFCEGVATCYEDGERAIGAEGFPAVSYLPCCSGAEPTAKDGDWGLFCGGGGAAKTCYEASERAIGAEGFEEVPYLPCCSGAEPTAKEGDWGLFCDIAIVRNCYNPGDRAIGAEGFPAVEYKPCCTSADPVAKDGDWGLFCPQGVTNDGKLELNAFCNDDSECVDGLKCNLVTEHQNARSPFEAFTPLNDRNVCSSFTKVQGESCGPVGTGAVGLPAEGCVQGQSLTCAGNADGSICKKVLGQGDVGCNDPSTFCVVATSSGCSNNVCLAFQDLPECNNDGTCSDGLVCQFRFGFGSRCIETN